MIDLCDTSDSEIDEAQIESERTTPSTFLASVQTHSSLSSLKTLLKLSLHIGQGLAAFVGSEGATTVALTISATSASATSWSVLSSTVLATGG